MSNRPTPSPNRKLSGSNLHRINKNEPRYRRVDPEKIPMILDELGKEEWNRLAPELCELGTLNKASLNTFVAYCMSWSEFCRAQTIISDEGLIIREPIVSRKTGEIVDYIPKTNPAVAIANEAKRQMRAFAIEFGITPASATKVAAVPVETEKKSSFGDFMEGPEEEIVVSPADTPVN